MPSLTLASLRLPLEAPAVRRRPLLMGIVNVTPDSFYDGGHHDSPEKAAEHALALEAEGADLLDLGAESTRPGSEGISAREELRRLLPVLELLKGRSRVPISIDTQKAEVARRAFEMGASLLNDVSALRTDPSLAAFAAERGCPVILMHMQGTPRDMQADPRYQDVTREVMDFLDERLDFFVRQGGRASQVLVDPGIGFGKHLGDNLALLRDLPKLKAQAPVVVGVSRKSFLGRLLAGESGRAPVESRHSVEQLPPPGERYEASLAAGLFAAERGADVLRVHDVQGTRRALEVWSALSAGETPP